MWLRNPLDDIFSSQAKVGILRVLCSASGPLNGREISRRAGWDAGHTSRLLRELAASGVVIGRDQGRVTSYEMGADDVPLVRALQALFRAEATRYDKAMEALMRAVPEALSIVLFGSEARHQAKPGSDTDLLIVVPEKSRRLEQRLADICLQLARQHLLALSWHVADLGDLEAWEEAGHELWQNIVTDGITLRGTSVPRLRRKWQHGQAV